MARRRNEQLLKSMYWTLFMQMDLRESFERFLEAQNFPLAAIRPVGEPIIRTNFAQAAPTGRWSSQNPPRSNISRREVPEAVIQDEEHTQLVEIDYAGFELRVGQYTQGIEPRIVPDTERRIGPEERERVRRAVLGVPGLPGPLVVPFEIMPFQEEVLRAAGVTVTRVHDSVNIDFGDLDAATIRALMRHIGLVPARGESSNTNTPRP